MRNFFNKTIIWSMILSLSSPSAWAIDLNTKIKNTDRSLFNSNPGVGIKEGEGGVFLEYNSSGSPMVIRNKTTGKIEPLVSGLSGLDLGINYGFTSWIQLGVLLPMEMTSGAEKNSTYLLGPYFEAKFKVHENFAIVPSYQMGSNSKISVKVNNQLTEVPMGSPNGTVGAKVVGQMGNVLESWGLAGQVGYYSSSGNEFSTIDQSSKILMGASAGMPLSESINGIVELYGEKTDSSFPLEFIGMINVKGETLNWQLGAGTGNIQGSGSNTYKAFVGLTYSFGGEKSYRSSNQGMPTLKPRKQQMPTSNPQFNNQPVNPIMEDSMDEQLGPEVPEPESSKDPAIPDVNGTSIEGYSGRNLASVVEPTPVKIVEEVPKEVKDNTSKKTKTKVVAKTRMATLPNGQKVKIFEKEITELPKDTKVMFVTEEGYQQLLKKIAQEEKDQKERLSKLTQTASYENNPITVINPEVKPKVDLSSIPTEPVAEIKVESELKVEEKPVIPTEVPSTPVKIVETPAVVNAVPVKEKEVDPVPMVGENPPKELAVQAASPTPVTVEPEIPVVPVNVEELLKKQQQQQVPQVTTQSEDKKEEVPKVTISIQQRDQLKNQIMQEFDKDSLQGKRELLDAKVKEENEKINAEISKKAEAEAAEKAKLEAEAIAAKAAAEEKDLRENAPLAESSEAVPGKAATEEELKPVKITDKKNRQSVIIELPKQKLNAFLEGKKSPKVPTPEAGEKTMNLLEESSDIEESTGPSYGFGSEE